MNHDNKVREDFKRNPASVFAWILMSSWVYYAKPSFTPLLSDEAFDKMCRWTLDHYDELHHPHAKPLITKEDLRTGSLFALSTADYPYWAIHISERLSLELDK